MKKRFFTKDNGSKASPFRAGSITVTFSVLLMATLSMSAFAQWNLPEGAIARLGKGYIRDKAFSPDGELLAMVDSLGIWIYDTENGQEVAHIEYPARSVSFSPDGQTLVTVGVIGHSGEVRLWDVATGTLRKTLQGHIALVSFSPDGQTLVTASSKEVQLWDVATGTLRGTFRIHASLASLVSVSLSRDSQTLVGVERWDNAVYLWDVANGTPPDIVKHEPRYQTDISLSRDGQTWASTQHGELGWTVHLWDVATGTLRKTLQGHGNVRPGVSFSGDGQTLASVGSGEVRLWNVADGTLLNKLDGHASGTSVSLSGDGQTLVTAGSGEVRLWDVETGTLLNKLVLADFLGKVSFSADGQTLASGSGFAVHLWNVADGTLLKTLEEQLDHSFARSTAGWVNSVSFSGDGQTLASGSGDGKVRLWDVATGTLRKTLQGHTDSVNSVSFSPDGQTLASGSGDGKVHLWDVETGTLLKTLEFGVAVRSVSFSPDGQTLASGHGRGSSHEMIHLWDVATGTHLRGLKHSYDIGALSFSPDGQMLVTAGLGDLRLWDVATGTLLKTLKGYGTGSVNSVSFSPDGQTLVTADSGGDILLWRVVPRPAVPVVWEPVKARVMLQEFIGLKDPFAAVAGIAPAVDILDAADILNISSNWEDIAKGREPYSERLDANQDGSVNERDLQLVEFALKLDVNTDGSIDQEDANEIAEAVRNGDENEKYDVNGDETVNDSDRSIVNSAVKAAIKTISPEWRIPEGLISEVAYGENSTYFVFTPGFAKSDNAVGYKSTITLDIPGTYDFDKNKTVQELLDDIEAISDSPAYFMFPLVPPDANELAEAISEIAASEDKTLGSVFKAYGSYLLEAAKFGAGLLYSPIGWFFGGIEVLKAGLNFELTFFEYLFSYFSDNGYLSTRFSELADNDDGKIILETFIKVYENPSQEIEAPCVGNLTDDIPKFLIMIPKWEPGVKIVMEQHFFRRDRLLPITINEVLSEEHFTFNPDGTLGSVLQFQLQLNQKIIIINGDYSKSLKSFLEFSLSDGGSSDPKWKWEYSDGKLVLSGDDREDIEKLLTNIYDMVENTPVGDIPVVDLDTFCDPNSPDFSVPGKVDLNIPLAAYSSNTLAAPHAQPISLSDYPPFQQLPPEIQAYLLQHFEGTATPKPLNIEAWEIPLETSLLANYPNPFNPETWIPYQLATPADVTLTIYDIQGRVVRDLDLRHQRAGMYHTRSRAAYWDGKNTQGESVASGVYFYTLTAGDFTATRKMLIRK